MAGGVKTFLMSLGMGRYVNMFELRGYDDEVDIPHLNVSDLQTVGITDPVEIIVILKAAQCYKQRPEYDLLRWLRENGLGHYYEGFVQSGRVLLSDIAELDLPDEEVYDELEITLPGHIRRLECAVQALRRRQRPEGSEGDERVVTEGWWGFPSYLPNAKYPFLCVKAIMQSTREPESQMSVDFMVDSGSDVSTLREDIVQMLNLEPITTVRSFGAHGSVRTTMYRAFIFIGDSKLEIEVIGSSYDSVGSRVLRHFNHHIDSSRHKWLRANNNTTMSFRPAICSSGENVNTETETVSVLPERERGTPYSRIFQENPGGSRTGGDGSSSYGNCGNAGSVHSFSPAGMPAGKDETDSAWLSSQLMRTVHSSGVPSHLKNTSDASWSPSKLKNTEGSPWLSSPASYHCSASSGHFNKHPQSLSDTTDRVHYTQESFPRMSQERTSATFSECSPSRQGPSSWEDDPMRASPRTSQHTPSRQGGHLMISEDGTISLSFGRDVRRKRQWEDVDGSRSEKDL